MIFESWNQTHFVSVISCEFVVLPMWALVTMLTLMQVISSHSLIVTGHGVGGVIASLFTVLFNQFRLLFMRWDLDCQWFCHVSWKKKCLNALGKENINVVMVWYFMSFCFAWICFIIVWELTWWAWQEMIYTHLCASLGLLHASSFLLSMALSWTCVLHEYRVCHRLLFGGYGFDGKACYSFNWRCCW